MKKLLIVGSILFFFFFIMIFLLPQKPGQPINLPFIPTPTPVNSQSTEFTNPEVVSPYQKTVIGETKESDLHQLSDVSVTDAGDGERLYSTSSVNPLVPDEIRVKNGSVVYERTSTYTTNPGGTPSLKSLMKDLGAPEQVIQGNDTYGPAANAYLFPKKGYAFVGNPITDETYEIQQFVPMTLLDYLKKYGDTVKYTPGDDQAL